jgi:hypothetical protein
VRLGAGALFRDDQHEPEGVAVGGDRGGLAWRLLISRSVKNACIVGASAVTWRPPCAGGRAVVERARRWGSGTRHRAPCDGPFGARGGGRPGRATRAPPSRSRSSPRRRRHQGERGGYEVNERRHAAKINATQRALGSSGGTRIARLAHARLSPGSALALGREGLETLPPARTLLA